MAIMAGVGILAALVAVIATRRSDRPQSASSATEAVRIAAEIVRLRIDGGESGDRRRALKAALKDMPDQSLTRALKAFADGTLEAAVRENPESPFARGLRGWILIELGRYPEGLGELRQALKEAPANWEFRPLFESALRKAE
jgi:hypothetical protein